MKNKKMSQFRNKYVGTMFGRSFALIVVIVFFSLIISGLFLLMLSGSYWKESMRDDLTGDAESLSDRLVMMMEDSRSDDLFATRDTALASVYLLQTVSACSGCDIFLTDENGRVLLCSDGEGPETDWPFSEASCPRHRGGVIPAEYLREDGAEEDTICREGVVPGFGEERYIVASCAIRPGGFARYYIVLMKQRTIAYRALSSRYIGMLLFSSSVAVLLSLAAAYNVSYRIVQPLKKISEATHQYAQGNFSFRINAKDTYREIGDLADSVNSMAESLAVTEESRSNFVSNVSHELKTPMTTISGFIDGVLDGTIAPEEREKYLRIVSEETKRLSRLVVDMLNMSKMEAGKLTLDYTDVELSAMLFRIIFLFEDEATRKRIAVKGLDAMEKTVVWADESLIYQVFYNIIDNAVKFTPEDGEIAIGLAAAKKSVAVTVRNTGKGIPEAERGLIFERFYKVDKSRRLDSKSFGVGLRIAKSIVDLHGGSICINSEENAYTEFVVERPVQPQKPQG